MFLPLAQTNNGSQSAGMTMMIVSLAVVLVAVVWTMVNESNYKSAKVAFEADPSDPVKKQEFFEAAKARGRYTHRAVEAMEVLEAAEKDRTKSIAKEIEALAKLHREGALTDAEFEQAKARLLR